MNYIFKERLKESLSNLVWLAVCILLIDLAIMGCVGSAPLALAGLAWVCVGIIVIYVLIVLIWALSKWVHWLFIEPFKKNRI